MDFNEVENALKIKDIICVTVCKRYSTIDFSIESKKKSIMIKSEKLIMKINRYRTIINIQSKFSKQ